MILITHTFRFNLDQTSLRINHLDIADFVHSVHAGVFTAVIFKVPAQHAEMVRDKLMNEEGFHGAYFSPAWSSWKGVDSDWFHEPLVANGL